MNPDTSFPHPPAAFNFGLKPDHPPAPPPLMLNPVTAVQQQLYMNQILQQFNPIQNPFLVAQLQLANALKSNPSILPNINTTDKSQNEVINNEVIEPQQESLDLSQPRVKEENENDKMQTEDVTDDEVLDKIKGKPITVSRISTKDLDNFIPTANPSPQLTAVNSCSSMDILKVNRNNVTQRLQKIEVTSDSPKINLRILLLTFNLLEFRFPAKL